MSAKRKDNKGRVLRTGESQRTDLTYQYRYTDITGKRRTVYANDLQELRKKEKSIQKDVEDGINYCEGNITVIELLDKNSNPKVGMHLDHHMQWAMQKYRRTQKIPLPTITPHVLRHTFCSNMAKSGMNPKTLQYIMGHSDISVTLNTYTHIQFEDAKEEFDRVMEV